VGGGLAHCPGCTVISFASKPALARTNRSAIPSNELLTPHIVSSDGTRSWRIPDVTLHPLLDERTLVGDRDASRSVNPEWPRNQLPSPPEHPERFTGRLGVT
jgi:hypothetical protein